VIGRQNADIADTLQL